MHNKILVINIDLSLKRFDLRIEGILVYPKTLNWMSKHWDIFSELLQRKTVPRWFDS